MRPAAAAAWPLRSGTVIAVAALLGLGLRVFQLTRPGYLTGFTQYDDGVYIGNALRLVDGVIPYRDFAMVQPPGSMLLMVPAALGGKIFGSAWALAAARMLTVGADTANVVLAGLLVRHRGPLAAGLASGVYAVYPAALSASQSLFLEPWLNLFCLLGAVLLFDGDRIRGLGGSGGPGRRTRGALWAGVCFGFAAAIKIWAAIPALVAWVLCLPARRGPGAFAGGFAAGIAVPCLPFRDPGPGWLRADRVRLRAGPGDARPGGREPPGGGHHRHRRAVQRGRAPAHLAGRHGGRRLVPVRGHRLAAGQANASSRATALDWYALVTTIVVVGMLFSPSEWYVHYAAFAGPFLVVLLGLSAARLFTPGKPRPEEPGKNGESGKKPARSG